MANENEGRVVELADLNTATVRERNDQVDKKMASLEEKIEDLEDEKADLKAEKSSLEDERDGFKEALEAFRDDQRSEAIGTIEEAAETLLPDDADIDTDRFEDLDADVVSEVASVLDTAAQAQQAAETVPQNEANPELSTVETSDGDGLSDQALQAAEAVGMAEELQKVEAGESLAESGPKSNIGNGQQAQQTTQPQQGGAAGAGDADLQKLLQAVDENNGGA